MEGYNSFVGSEQLVKNVSEVVANIKRFNEDIGDSEYLISNLSRFKDWYYDSDTKKFGPKKFVGFKNMTAKKYVALKANPQTNSRGDFDSSLTTDVLAFLSVTTEGEIERQLIYRLKEFLSTYDKTPRNIVKIYVIR